MRSISAKFYQLGHRVLGHRIAVLALMLGDELRQADQDLRHPHRIDHAAGALPQAERLGEQTGELHLARQEYPFPGHEDVVEHHEALGDAVVGARRIV